LYNPVNSTLSIKSNRPTSGYMYMNLNLFNSVNSTLFIEPSPFNSVCVQFCLLNPVRSTLYVFNSVYWTQSVQLCMCSTLFIEPSPFNSVCVRLCLLNPVRSTLYVFNCLLNPVRSTFVCSTLFITTQSVQLCMFNFVLTVYVNFIQLGLFNLICLHKFSTSFLRESGPWVLTILTALGRHTVLKRK